MPYADRPSRLTAWLHRQGISRRINAIHEGGRGWTRCTVDTAVPWSRLARVATRWETPHPISRERLGRWQWRWVFGQGTR